MLRTAEEGSAPVLSAKALLYKAAWELAEWGWVQGKYTSPFYEYNDTPWQQAKYRAGDVPMCAAGALRKAAAGHPLHLPVPGEATEAHAAAWDVLTAVIRERTERDYSVTLWNDLVCRSREEAVEMLEAAARRAE